MNDYYYVRIAWECPRCKKVNAPHSNNCDCLPNETERGDRLEAMIDRMSETISECVLLILPMRDLILQIEKCGASEELTKAVVMADDITHRLMDATGVKQLPPPNISSQASGAKCPSCKSANTFKAVICVDCGAHSAPRRS